MEDTITKCVNGSLKVGDLVISAPDDDYGCLIGRVLRINLAGSPEHDAETDNETDDVHVDFFEYEYSENRIREIEDMFSDLYGEKRGFDELPLDDTVMAPQSLIRITDMEDCLDELLKSGYEVARYCYVVLRMLQEHTEAGNKASADITHILETISPALSTAGYNVTDGGECSVIARDSRNGAGFEINVRKL